MSGWISVKDQLPTKGVYVLWAFKAAAREPRPVVEGFYEPWMNGMQFWRATRTPSLPRSLSEVTHWQPLPEPPKEPK